MKIEEKIDRAMKGQEFVWPTEVKVIPWPWFDYLEGEGPPFNREQWTSRTHKDFRSHNVGDLVHNGNDVRARANAKILSVGFGIICFSAHIKGYGYTIVISHGDGIYSLYAHLAQGKELPRRGPVGTQVTGGDEIARSGKKGIDHQYASHLHIEGRHREGELGQPPSQNADGWLVHDPSTLWYFDIMKYIRDAELVRN